MDWLRSLSRSSAVLWLATGMLCAGCSESSDPVREYVISRPAAPGSLWFFKVLGPEAAVDREAKRVQDFVTSVQFSDQTGLPTWTLPSGWTEQPSDNSIRYRTIQIPGDPPLELAVTQIAGKVPPSVDDIQRQAEILQEQVGQPAATEKPAGEGSTASREPNIGSDLQAGTLHGRLFDLKGETPRFGKTRLLTAMIAVPVPANRSGAAAAGPAAGGALPFDYQAPEGWSSAPQTTFSVVSMSAGEGTSVASMTITPAMGDLLSNVNRWRGQAGEPDVKEADLPEILDVIEAPPNRVLYTEAIGKERAILGAVFVADGRSWYVKLDGPPDAVKAERERFRKFLETIKPRE